MKKFIFLMLILVLGASVNADDSLLSQYKISMDKKLVLVGEEALLKSLEKEDAALIAADDYVSSQDEEDEVVYLALREDSRAVQTAEGDFMFSHTLGNQENGNNVVYVKVLADYIEADEIIAEEEEDAIIDYTIADREVAEENEMS